MQAPEPHSKIARPIDAVSRPFRGSAYAHARRVRLAGPVLGLAALLFVVEPGVASAQGQFIPYFGKNNIHYDKFDWHIYTTDHFEIYYYPEIEQHLERIAGYAESAYQQVSADLKHDLSFKVPLILFKTHSEFEQQNVAPGAAQEGVGAFAEPYARPHAAADRRSAGSALRPHRPRADAHLRVRHHSAVADPPQRAAVGERRACRTTSAASGAPLDLMTVRDAAVADIVPKMSELEGYGNTNNPRLIYNLGHAVFEFIEAKYGKEGIRQFLFALRKSVIGGGEDAYEEALQMKKDEFDQAFERYLKDRFKPFRDKERPADYGRDLRRTRRRPTTPRRCRSRRRRRAI